MKRSDFSFVLPRERIARFPSQARPDSRLMVVDRQSGKVAHSSFSKLEEWLNPTDFLVINNSRVVPVRLFGTIGGKKVELLLVRRREDGNAEAYVRPGKACVPGTRIVFEDGITADCTGVGERGRRLLVFHAPWEAILATGFAPLPPYIKRTREEAREFRDFDLDRYQTVYARNPGSIAAPTAGLHFSRTMMDRIRQSHGVEEITLDVGAATFQPVEVDRLEDHRMGRESIEMPRTTMERILERRKNGKLVAVGTTTVRSLETWARLDPVRERFESEIFIFPGFKFRMVDRLVTNFHLPESSLFMLVCAFAGRELMLEAYRGAVEAEYRFFSYGDAMLIL